VLPILDAPEFRTTFDDKTPFSAIMREMPIYVMTAKDAAITGIAGYVCNPERFAPGNGIRHFRHKAH
ncbi:MAG: glucokinase, partial [Alphaproteobacteria bacterium]|nr:glucokinase [Alphaproteobacteria bacterium]